MGLFDSFKNYREKSRQRRIEKSIKHLMNAKAMKEDREAALEFLVGYDDAEIAVPALLGRFRYSLEHGIRDSREKERCLEGILRHKENALPHIKKDIQTTDRIAWHIKALNKLGTSMDVIEALKGCLDLSDTTFNQSKTDKNFDVLCYLRDYQIPGFMDVLKTFLEDNDERVRFAALEVIIAQDDSQVPSLVEPYLVDKSSENTRLRQVAIEAFVENKWKLGDTSPFPEGFIAEGIKINKDKSVSKV